MEMNERTHGVERSSRRETRTPDLARQEARLERRLCKFMRALSVWSRLVRTLTAALTIACIAVPSSAATDVLDTANFDTSISPKTDFYQYAVGGWRKTHPIPGDRTSWGSFDEVDKRNELRVREIMESPDVTDAAVGSERRKIGDYYAACTDTELIERNGFAPLRARLATVDTITGSASFAPIFAHLSATGAIAPGFAFGSEQDPKAATRVIASIGQGGTTLPTRDYYLAKDARSVAIRAALRQEIATSFTLVGDDAATAARESAAVLDLETKLATASKSPDALRDPFANYHPMPLARLETLAPGFDWPSYFSTAGVRANVLGTIDVNQPEFVHAFTGFVRDVPLATWKSYLRWRIIEAAGPAAPRALRSAAFAFSRELYGLKAQPPRTRTCVRATDGALGFAVGKVYVAKYFPPSARARAREEIAAIGAALRADIDVVPWMSAQTRAAAHKKFSKFSTLKVGYPDKWLDYTHLAVDRSDFLGDVLAARAFAFARDAAKIGKPVDRTEWGLTPQTVNAYYDPSMNEIVIPAGILEKPFFDPDADDAVNFGGIGVIIGHEMTHGYDDEGSDFDGDGNLHPIVTKADAARFHARVQCIIDQLDGFSVPGKLHLNGKLDAGEAAADLGGLTLSYRAMEAQFAKTGHPEPLGGFTAEQRYFLSFAQVWRENQRPQAERAQVLGDPHPVSRYRVDGTVADAGTFDAAFGVAPGDGMYRAPAKRCAIW
jgi:putative endopeptidase